MRYFVDTEFNWHPQSGQIRPLSIGIVAEDGREYYGVANTIHSFSCTPFVKAHVLPVLGSDAEPKFRSAIGAEIRAFIGEDVPEFWGDYAAFDYVVLSMLMGDFSDWPDGWPMHINDLQQDAVPSVASAIPHNALADARAVRDSWTQWGEPPKPDHPCAICGERERDFSSDLCDRCALERYRAHSRKERA